MHLDEAELPEGVRDLLSPATVDALARELLPDLLGARELIEVTAHRMVAGQTIRIHNDFRAGGETHRILVQLNRGWVDDQGGLLMLFGSGRVEDVQRVIRPVHGSGFGFRISELSFHAVSTIAEGERFTLVYSFRETAD
jgi:Rps23 Pro-64 3,4-dihydroxylase Tpa1-like proline 4-hydroxylase